MGISLHIGGRWRRASEAGRSTISHMSTFRRSVTGVFGIVSLIFAAGFLSGCGKLTQGKAAGEKAVADFHALYNQGKVEDIWKEADPKFRRTTTKQQYDDLMGAVQRKLGNVVSTANNGWQVRSFNLTTSVLLAQNTTFEHGQGTESFTFALNGTNAVLVGYNIQSMDLITK
jgi:hypothetical protein